MINKFVIKFLPTCLPSGLTVAAPDAFGRIPGVFPPYDESFLCNENKPGTIRVLCFGRSIYKTVERAGTIPVYVSTKVQWYSKVRWSR